MRRLLLTLLAGLAALSGGAYAMRALHAGGQGEFDLSIQPDRQTAIGSQAVTYSVTVTRAKAFNGAITLRLARLPAGTRASWELADGTPSGVVPPGQNGASLILRTSSRTPIGERHVIVRASGGGQRRTSTLTLLHKRRRYFDLTAGPVRQLTGQGDAAVIAVHVARARGFAATVRLSVLRHPPHATMAWLPRRSIGRAGRDATLFVRVPNDARPGSSRLVIYGRSRTRGKRINRYAVVWLTVAPRGRFSVSGDLAVPLHPGLEAPLDLTLKNPNNFALRVLGLTVAVRPATSSSACNGSANFAVAPYSGPTPLLLRPGSTRLSALVPDPARWPQVAMLDLPFNQDACRRTRLVLDYGGTAVR